MHTVADKNGLSEKTQGRRLSAIREFYRYLFSEDIIKKNPADYLLSPKVGKSLPKYLSEEEVVRLLQTAEKEDKRINAKSLLGILSLGILCDTKITLIADGADEREALEALRNLAETSFE